jgi:hypothetical protein
MDTKLTLRTLMNKSIISDLPYEAFPDVMGVFLHVTDNMFAIDSILKLDSEFNAPNSDSRPLLNMKI